MVFRILCLLYFLLTIHFAKGKPVESFPGFIEGKNSFEKTHYNQAITLFLKEIPKANKEPENLSKLAFYIAESYRFLKKYNQAEEWYRKSWTTDTTFKTKEKMIRLAEVLHYQSKLDEAGDLLKLYEKNYGSDEFLEKRKASLELAKKELAKRKTNYQVNIEKNLLSQANDINPKIVGKEGKMIIFASSREGGVGFKKSPITGDAYYDLYYSTQDNKNRWMTPQPFDASINSQANDADATLSATGDTMYFSKCSEGKNVPSPCKIYWAVKTNSIWQKAVVLDQIDLQIQEPTASFMHPNLSDDGQKLFFSSNIKHPSSQGGYDIWFCNWKDNKWSECQNAGPTINTQGDEVYPYFNSSKNTLYFSTDARIGMGGLDVYSAILQNNAFTEPINMGYPINSTGDDFGFSMQMNGKIEKGFLSSNRVESDMPQYQQRDRIYSFTGKNNQFELTVEVKDEFTGQPLADVKVMIEGRGEDNSTYSVMTNKAGKVFLGMKDEEKGYILPNTTYIVSIVKPEIKMLTEKQLVSTKGKEDSESFYVYFNAKIDRQKPLSFPEVRYDLDKYTLQVNKQVNSKDSLNYLFRLLTDNPTITIQIQAHTDARGSVAYNEDLSQKRAQECVRYLTQEKNIDPARLDAVGFGKRQHRYSEDFIQKQPKEEQEKYHQLNRRTEFIVTSWNFSPRKTKKK